MTVGALQRVDGQCMGVSQDFVDLADLAGTWRGRVEAGEPASGRTSAPERRGAAEPAGFKARLAAGKAPGLARQIVERGGQCSEALVEPRRAHGTVGRWRRRQGRRLGDARKANARGGVWRDKAAAAGLRPADKPGTKRTPQRIEERQAQGTRAGEGACGCRGQCKIGGLHHDGDAEAAQQGSMVLGFGLVLRGRGRVTARPCVAAMISRRAAASAGRNSRNMASQRWRGRVGTRASVHSAAWAIATSMATMRFRA